MKVDFFRHNITADERKALDRTLKGLFISTGDEVAEFERRFAKYLSIKHIVGVTSATAALHLALEALGIGEGDEVITTPMTFVASAHAIIHAGARPVFVDVIPDTGEIDPAAIEKAITKKTRAILPVHLYGQMCDMKAISKIARKHKLKIVEDAAHAVEAQRDGVIVGQLADAAAFSFYATKNITAGEGGAISVHNKRLRDKLISARLHGMSKDAAARYGKKFAHYDVPTVGWKYNMSNIQAALLIPQLDRIEKNLKVRQKLWDIYADELSGVKNLELPTILPNSRSALHLFTAWVPSKKRDNILQQLQDKGIGVAVNFRPVHLMSYYRKRYGFKRGMFPHAERIGDRVITLPFYPTLKPKQLKYVSNTLKGILEKI